MILTNVVRKTEEKADLIELGNYLYWIQVKATKSYTEAKSIIPMQNIYGSWLETNINNSSIYIIEAKETEDLIGIGMLTINKEFPTSQNKTGNYAVLDNIICSSNKIDEKTIQAEIIFEVTRFLNNNNTKILLTKKKEYYDTLYDAGYISIGIIDTFGVRLKVPVKVKTEIGESRKQKKEHITQDEDVKIR